MEFRACNKIGKIKNLNAASEKLCFRFELRVTSLVGFLPIWKRIQFQLIQLTVSFFIDTFSNFEKPRQQKKNGNQQERNGTNRIQKKTEIFCPIFIIELCSNLL